MHNPAGYSLSEGRFPVTPRVMIPTMSANMK
jgi:hypothetical protein